MTSARAEWVDTYSGKYNLSCQRARITAQLDVSGGVGAQSGSQSFPFSIELSCDKDDPAFLSALDQLQTKLTDSCMASTQGLFGSCGAAAESYTDALYDVNAALVDMTPGFADMRVYSSTSWANVMFNIYPFNGLVKNAQGAPQYVQFLINRYGQFGAAGIQVFGGNGVGNNEAGLGCIAWATAVVNGTINANDAYRMNAGYALNANLTCGAANQSAAWFLVNMNVGVSGVAAGPKSK
jgi:hypothetical protein